MFLFALGGSVVLGAGLFAVASFSEGALLAMRTVAQVIGWLFLIASLAGATVLNRAHIGSITAVGVTSVSAFLLLYVSHFDWNEIRTVRSTYAALEARHQDLEVIEDPSPALAAAMGLKEIVVPALPPSRASADAGMKEFVVPQRSKAEVPKPVVASSTHVAAPVHKELPMEGLQRSRCSQKAGLARLLCLENARLEYCQSRPTDEAACPSPIPQSHPG